MASLCFSSGLEEAAGPRVLPQRWVEAYNVWQAPTLPYPPSGRDQGTSHFLVLSSRGLACQLFTPFFSFQMKLLNLYIKRAQTTNSNSSSSSDVSTHS